MVAQSCKAVIACRARKDQKAKLTRLVREGNREVVTLGVGDGANDVEMIRAAHIGVGIIGKEGTQAVNNADYAISQFRYLTRLILVYGHHEYRGITLAALLIFYKNILFTLIQYLYTFVCGLSGTRNQSYTAIFWYNTALTAFGPLLLAVFDKDVTDANCYKFPQLHRQGIEHRLFSVKRFLVYMAKAVYEAVAIGLVVNLTMSRCDFPTGTLDVWLYGTIAVTINIFVANVSASIEQSRMMGVTVFFFWGTFFFWLLLVLFNSLSLDLFPDYFGSFSLLFSRPVFYLVFLLATVLSILPTMMLKALQREWAPTLSQFIQDVQVRGADADAVEAALEKPQGFILRSEDLLTAEDKAANAEPYTDFSPFAIAAGERESTVAFASFNECLDAYFVNEENLKVAERVQKWQRAWGVRRRSREAIDKKVLTISQKQDERIRSLERELHEVTRRVSALFANASIVNTAIVVINQYLSQGVQWDVLQEQVRVFKQKPYNVFHHIKSLDLEHNRMKMVFEVVDDEEWGLVRRCEW